MTQKLEFLACPFWFEGYVCLALPSNSALILGSTDKIWIEGHLGQVEFACWAYPSGDGAHFLFVSRILQSQTGLLPGEKIKAVLWAKNECPEDPRLSRPALDQNKRLLLKKKGVVLKLGIRQEFKLPRPFRPQNLPSTHC